MQTTFDLDVELLEKARRVTGIEEEAQLLHLGLQALIQEQEGTVSASSSKPKETRQPGHILPVFTPEIPGWNPAYETLEEAIAAADFAEDLRKLGKWQ